MPHAAMKSAALPIPGIVFGAYPERREAKTRRQPLEIAAGLLASLPARRQPARYRRFAEKVAALDAHMAISPADALSLRRHVRALRAKMAMRGLTDELIAEAFVLIQRACARELSVSVYATQLIAARIMLDRQLAEMSTGEGKTLAAALCAATCALAGIPVHVITANDYLVTRDAQNLRALYRALGLSVGVVTQPLALDARRAAYDCDIVYCTASELVFDYLRDGMARGQARNDLHARAAALDASASARAATTMRPNTRPTLLRGLCMGIVDEADSVLIDDARVPLILSTPAPARAGSDAQQNYFEQALRLAQQLQLRTDFTLDRDTLSAHLSEQGRGAVERLAAGLDSAWRNRRHREESVCTALAALHLYQRDRHYLARDAKVQIIDAATGRIAAGRAWSRGLQQLIELKEGCAPAPERVTAAQITYQRFFQRYLGLAGMSGTLSEARGELLAVYGLRVVDVELRTRSRLQQLPTRLFADRVAQRNAAVREATELAGAGRAVLLGTDSVEESEHLSRGLVEAGVAHCVLNARQDADEALIVAQAGQAGRITVATNMAGRGTDIALEQSVVERGGLHVISCQHNASRRIDRQLLGRCARQGNPGSAQTLLALDQPLIEKLLGGWFGRGIARSIAARAGERGCTRPGWLIRLLMRLPQKMEERRQRAQRRLLLEHDARMDNTWSFGKPRE